MNSADRESVPRTSAFRTAPGSPEPESLDDLIADCRDIPRPHVPGQRPYPSARPWNVDEACHAQVSGLDAYV
ncbi:MULTISPECIES: hypothetical protein [Prauserella salsuginis group]|uniref:Uncharacterized protein n=2 Tax=Prauserella salsuginis group TaxID=2893672 RepID=A0A839XMR0_9PSEU|nr:MULTISPECIES: hypothetical protein [Prauserella salsuginis group]MBB3661205.1 hypothetical protein [Prauserella sediminis]